jgi:hypothetical protein
VVELANSSERYWSKYFASYSSKMHFFRILLLKIEYNHKQNALLDFKMLQYLSEEFASSTT